MHRSTFEMRYSIWYHLYNLRNLKTPQTTIKKSFFSTKKLVRCACQNIPTFCQHQMITVMKVWKVKTDKQHNRPF